MHRTRALVTFGHLSLLSGGRLSVVDISSSFRPSINTMLIGNGMLYPVIGLASCVAFIYMSFGDLDLHILDLENFRLSSEPKMSFVGRNGTQFAVDGEPFYVNGWNSWWLMDQAVEEFSRPRVRAIFQSAARMGLTVCRTWAFNDGAYNALQVSLGQFDERVFQVCDS